MERRDVRALHPIPRGRVLDCCAMSTKPQQSQPNPTDESLDDEARPVEIDLTDGDDEDGETDPVDAVDDDAEDEHEVHGQDDDRLPPPCPDLALSMRVEAILMSVDRPISESRIVDLLVLQDEGGVKAVRSAVEELNRAYDESGRCFRVEAVAGGFQMMTRSSVAPILSRLHQSKHSSKLTPAALETLAIVAYRQPILRAEIEAIRGVACGEVLRTLMERRLVKITGRAEELGRPMLYGTTKEFLRAFGLARLEDLPQAKDLREPARKG